MSLTGNLAKSYGSSQAVLGLLHNMRPFMVLQSDHDYVRNTFYIAVGHVHVANNDRHFDHLISRILSGQVVWHSYRQNSTSQCLEVVLNIPPVFYNSSQIQMSGPVNQGMDNAGQVHQDSQTANSCVQDNASAQDNSFQEQPQTSSAKVSAALALNSLSSVKPLAQCLEDLTDVDWSLVDQSTAVKSESAASNGATASRGQKRTYSSS